MIEVSDQAHLEALPDGTIITWLRIPGDETSRAVAFVHSETERVECAWAPANGEPINWVDQRVVWISPGGWQPMTPDDAGITYPVSVVQLGGTITAAQIREALPQFDSSPPPVFGELISGGTYPRDHALECAARALGGGVHSVNATDHTINILDMADKFVEWLNAEPDEKDDQ